VSTLTCVTVFWWHVALDITHSYLLVHRHGYDVVIQKQVSYSRIWGLYFKQIYPKNHIADTINE